MNRNISSKTYIEIAKNVLINSNNQIFLPSNIHLPKGFIGRESELEEFQLAKIEGKMVFLLHGSGGVGKTDLALEFIKRNKSEYHAHIRIDV